MNTSRPPCGVRRKRACRAATESTAKRAGSLYRRARDLTKELADADPKTFTYQWDLGFVYYRLGQHALRTNDAAAVKGHFAACLKVREKLADQDKKNDRRKMELMLAQAHCGEHARAAAGFEKSIKPDAELFIDLTRAYAQCAAAVTDTASKQQYTNEATRVLRRAIALGYRDAVYLRTEVDLDPVRHASAFEALLSELSPRA